MQPATSHWCTYKGGLNTWPAVLNGVNGVNRMMWSHTKRDGRLVAGGRKPTTLPFLPHAVSKGTSISVKHPGSRRLLYLWFDIIENREEKKENIVVIRTAPANGLCGITDCTSYWRSCFSDVFYFQLLSMLMCHDRASCQQVNWHVGDSGVYHPAKLSNLSFTSLKTHSSFPLLGRFIYLRHLSLFVSLVISY